MDLELAKSTGAYFMPDSVSEIMGRYPRTAARIKTQPKFFRVEEQSTDTYRCTVGSESDLPPGHAFGCAGGSGHLTEVTMVKRCHTTPAAIDKVPSLLGAKPGTVRISYAGLKDRWAETSQRIVVEYNFDDVVRACMPDESQLDDVGIFLKDPVRTNRHLGKGKLIGNNFIIKVMVPGMNAAQLEDYVAQRVSHLTRGGVIMIPNAFGKQRLGKRQNLFGVGHDFIVHGAERGIKRFLTETSPNESPWAHQVRQKLASEWEAAEKKAAQNGGTVAQQVLYLRGMQQVLEEGGHGRQAYQKLNMTIEYRIVSQLLQHLSYEVAMQNLEDDFSLWTGAYQGFWFNQVLDKVLRGEITLDNQHDPEARIALFMDEERAFRFHKRFAPEALQPRMDPTVRRMFLRPAKKHDRGPRRPLFVPVKDLQYGCEDGAVNMKFRLPKGAYATTFLGILFNIDSEKDPVPVETGVE